MCKPFCIFTKQAALPLIIGLISLITIPTIYACNCSTSNGGIPGGGWNPSGIGVRSSAIIFTSDNEGNWEIYSIQSNGSNKINLTDHPSDDYAFTLSPDGSKIAFVSRRDGNDEIYAMNADGSNKVNLSNNKYKDRDPQWLPNGSKIVFFSDRDGSDALYIMDADGSNQIKLS